MFQNVLVTYPLIVYVLKYIKTLHSKCCRVYENSPTNFAHSTLLLFGHISPISSCYSGGVVEIFRDFGITTSAFGCVHWSRAQTIGEYFGKKIQYYPELIDVLSAQFQ